MASFVCENCNFKYIAQPEEFCVNCGYSFDYIRNYKNLAPSQLRNMPGLIKVRQAVCSIPEKDTTKKGLHAYCTITNQGILVEIFEKFEIGIFTKKKWKFKENPKIFIPYGDILSIDKGTFKGQPARFYNYTTKNSGVIPLGFYADGGINSPNLDLEMKELIERYMA